MVRDSRDEKLDRLIVIRPLAEIKSERERMETNGSGLINRSEKTVLPIDNRGAYKC